MTLQATFVRTLHQRDKIYVHRSDGSEISWTFPTYGSGLPHDLVHLVVEAGFDLSAGFWGRIDQGIDPDRVNAAANRQGGKGKEKYSSQAPGGGFGDDISLLYLAEELAVTRWGDGECSDQNLFDDLAVRALKCVTKDSGEFKRITLSRVGDVRRVLTGIRSKWAAFIPNGTLTLEFNRQDLGQSFSLMSSI